MLLKMTFEDGFVYEAESGKCKPERLNRVLHRLNNLAPDAVPMTVFADMPAAERMWILRMFASRAAFLRLKEREGQP